MKKSFLLCLLMGCVILAGCRGQSSSNSFESAIPSSVQTSEEQAVPASSMQDTETVPPVVESTAGSSASGAEGQTGEEPASGADIPSETPASEETMPVTEAETAAPETEPAETEDAQATQPEATLIDNGGDVEIVIPDDEEGDGF